MCTIKVSGNVPEISDVLLKCGVFENTWKELYAVLLEGSKCRPGNSKLWTTQLFAGHITLREIPKLILEEWIAKQGKAATLINLLKALEKVGWVDTMEELQILFGIDNDDHNVDAAEPTFELSRIIGYEMLCEPFIGRECELRKVVSFCKRGQGLLNIYGASGVGKTELLKKVACIISNEYEFLWVDLERRTENAWATYCILKPDFQSKLLLPDEAFTSQDLEEKIKTFALHGKKTVIIFDHVHAEFPGFNSWIGKNQQNAVIIVVSKEEYNMNSEESHQVEEFQSILNFDCEQVTAMLNIIEPLPVNIRLLRAANSLSKNEESENDLTLQNDNLQSMTKFEQTKALTASIVKIMESASDDSQLKVLVLVTFCSGKPIPINFLKSLLHGISSSSNFDKSVNTLITIGLLRRVGTHKLLVFSHMQRKFLEVLKDNATAKSIISLVSDEFLRIALIDDTALHAAEITLKVAVHFGSLKENVVKYICKNLDNNGSNFELLRLTEVIVNLLNKSEIAGTREFEYDIGVIRAVAYRRVGDLAESESLLKKLKVRYEEEFGLKNETFINIAHQLATACFESENYISALLLYEEILNRRIELYIGDNNVETQKTIANIANTYVAIFAEDPDKLLQAEKSLTSVKVWMKNNYCKLEELRVSHSLAFCQFKRQNYKEAKNTFICTAKEFETMPHINPRHVSTSRQMLAKTLEHLGEKGNALREYENLLKYLNDFYKNRRMIQETEKSIERLSKKKTFWQYFPPIVPIIFEKVIYELFHSTVILCAYELFLRPLFFIPE